MTSAEFLLWVRGPGLQISVLIFCFGMLLRLFEIVSLGRRETLAATRESGLAGGLRSMLTRSTPADNATAKRSMFTYVSGYVFHIGLFASIFLLVPHIELFESVLGFGWPGLPTPIVDFLVVAAMIALLASLYRRLTHPVLKFLSTGQDYLVWALTFIPLLTGYMAYHHLMLPYTWMLGLHILSVEILLILFPFTKLTHAFTLFMARFYTGYMAAQRGVKS